MIIFSNKTRAIKIGLQIIVIWTLVAASIATQFYLNMKLINPEVSWIALFLKQLPTWYLCALLTVVILFWYDRYPLDSHDWKTNLIKQSVIAFFVLLIFSHFRLWTMAFVMGKEVRQFSTHVYINSYLSQLAWDLAIYILITVSIFADKSNRKRRQNELYSAAMELRNKNLEHQLNAAQLEALKLQLSPHFLFNTLNTVNALIRAQENTKAIQVTTRLGDFLRTTLYTDHNPFVSLGEELRLLDLYLEIEWLRFSDRLIIEKEISYESLSIQVPHFILQPIIENAVKHGIAQSSEAKCISIKSYIIDQQLKIEIYNDGTLLSDYWTTENNPGIGLKNVSNRLKKTYNGQSSFSIRNHADKKGVQVLITLPVTS